ncbi:pheromone A receptor-domain-containing protein [Amylostereum chailletii]|nr:pheromone A receptor-domain-containing protein [Amylostereum chailletii]
MRPELPVGAFIAALLVLVPIPWHWRARSVPTLSMIAWLFIDCLTIGINSLIWAGSVQEVVPVWCDIVTKLNLGSTLALPAACLCLCIRLESISACRQVSVSYVSKRRWVWFDIAMCWALPMLYMVLHYIVQGHRFDIVEDLGCRATFYVSIPAIFIVFVPHLVVSIATLVMAALALRHFFRRRASFAENLRTSQSALTTARYMRLMCMSIVLMTWTLAVSILQVWFSSRYGLRPWTNWSDVHAGWLAVGQFPTAFFSNYDWSLTLLVWWTVPISAYFFAIFFMFGEDAMKEYRACWEWFMKHVLRRSPSTPKTSYLHSQDSMPSARTLVKRHTIVSLYPGDVKDNNDALPKRILSSAALRSFASGSPGTIDQFSPMPSTPSDYCPPDYESDDGIALRHYSVKAVADEPIHLHDMA